MFIDNLIQIAFILSIAISSAIGIVCLLMASIELLPLSISKGWNWFAVAAAPYYTSILLYNAPKYLNLDNIPKKLILVITLLLIVGPLYFCWRFGPDSSSVTKKLIIGLVLIAISAAMLYGFGDQFISMYIKSIQNSK